MTLAIGSKLGPYEILSLLGVSGMGEVWKERDTRLGRIVAIKKVKEQHSERFKQEARFIAALNHPYICQLHDIGEDYLVLEYVEGRPLSSPLPEREAVRLAIQIATALEAAHKKGIIHRDLKAVEERDSMIFLLPLFPHPRPPAVPAPLQSLAAQNEPGAVIGIISQILAVLFGRPARCSGWE